MKKILRKKWRGIPVAVIAVVLVAAIAIASTLLIIPSTVTIDPLVIPPTHDIEIYSDAEGTLEITEIAWGTTVQGTDIVETVYIKAAGTGDSAVTVSLSDAPANVTVTAGPLTVVSGNVEAFEITLVVPLSAYVGVGQTFTTDFLGSAP